MKYYVGILSGNWIATPLTITDTRFTDSLDVATITARKNVVFLANDNGYIKMVQNDDEGTAKYYVCAISDYDP